MNCGTCLEILTAGREGLADAADLAAAQSHLAACPACAAAAQAEARLAERLTALGAACAGAVVESVMARATATRPASSRARRALRWALPLAAAACLAGAIVIPLSVSQPAHAAPLALMVRKIRATALVSFSLDAPIDGWGNSSVRVSILDGRRQRMDLPDGRAIVRDLEQRKAMVLIADRRWAVLSAARDGVWNPYAALVALAGQPGVDLRTEVLDGRPARVVQTAAPELLAGEGDLTVWIDLETQLPLRVQWRQDMQGHALGAVQRTVTFSDFEFGGDMDPSLFSLDVPAGYEVRPPTDDPVVALKGSMLNARNVFMGAMTYHQAMDRWPARVSDLVEGGYITPDDAFNPRLPELGIGYVLFPPGAPEYDPNQGVLFEPLVEWTGGGVIAYADGHVEIQMDRARYNELLLAARARSGR